MGANRTRIMVVDDNLTNLKFVKSVLSEKYDVFTVPSAAKMFSLLDTDAPSLILLDINMPEMDGIEALKKLKEGEKTRDIPVIFITARNDPESEVTGLDLGAVDYISKPFEPPILRKRVEIHLTMELQRKTMEHQKRELQNFNDNLQRMVEEKTGSVLELQRAILNTLAEVVESRDEITGGHVQRTNKWLRIMLEGLQDFGLYSEEISDWDVNLMLQSSQLHDVGKISISDSILKKPGKLTSEEFEEMKRHSVFGAKIIDKIGENMSNNDFLTHSRIFALTHHEKWDGSGYPYNLRGEEIPLQGRIMAIADVYDALISDRPYKKAFSHEQASQIIMEGRGTHFDPVLVDVFEQVENKFRENGVPRENVIEKST
ncbi:MAG: response regulator [Synergistaceae bacterium]|jgi:putative two-component system response regulator|nr:response regulator [Synergistaceae bacterium]